MTSRQDRPVLVTGATGTHGGAVANALLAAGRTVRENLGDPRELIAEGELALPLPATRPLQQIALANLGAAVVALLARQSDIKSIW